MNPLKRGSEKGLDPQLWRACAGNLVRMPHVDSKVYYFPQGHAENASDIVDFGNLRIPSMVLCRVLDIKYMADAVSDELFAKLTLIPLQENEYVDQDCGDGEDGNGFEVNREKTPSFNKTLTQSDVFGGGALTVPRNCAEMIFLRSDYNADKPPVQEILAKDAQADVWKFGHIYSETSRRHVLTTGWMNFVNQKKLVAGDSIVFMRDESGELCVGIRRATCSLANREGRVTAESVIDAATLAISGIAFEVFYYPRASTSEFCVKALDVRAAKQIPWCSGMRIKMAFEMEDSSRISWYMGTVSAANVSDPIRWDNSPWRLLEVEWDEPELLQNVKRVNPWLVELVYSADPIPLTSSSPPRKKMRLSQHSDDNKMMSSSPVPSSPSHPLIRSSPLDGGSPSSKKVHDASGLETGQGNVDMESDDVGQTLDLSDIGSYEELSGKLSDMFGIQKPDMLRSVRYSDASGAIKDVGNESFSEFLKTARRLTILTEQGSESVLLELGSQS